MPFIDKPLIKVITGIRRSGKSTLLNQIADTLTTEGVSHEQIISINKELFEFDFIRNYADLHSFVSTKVKSKQERHYLFIDEVQEIDEWEKAINSFLAEGRYDIYISGSNARMLSSDLATLITGRYIEFKIFPFTFSEFYEIFKLNQHSKIQPDIFGQFLKYGGFPGLHYLLWEEEILRQYLASLYSTIVLKDLVVRNQIKDVSMLNHILEFIAVNCGNITTAKSISDFSKSQGRRVTSDTVLNYLEYANNALLVHKIKRYDMQGKRILETYEKYYLGDVGLGFAMVGNTPEMISGKLENIVLVELLSRGFNVSIGKNKDKEIDFIAQKGEDKVYIQVCTTLVGDKVYAREYKAFEGIDDHFPKYILSLDESGFSTNPDGVRWLNIKHFLLGDDSFLRHYNKSVFYR